MSGQRDPLLFFIALALNITERTQQRREAYVSEWQPHSNSRCEERSVSRRADSASRVHLQAMFGSDEAPDRALFGHMIGTVSPEGVSTPMPLFSIVVVHYQGVNSHETFLRGYRSIMAQSFADFEVLVFHDGPLLDESVTFPCPVTTTERRHNDWGHTLRDLGIRSAKGEYIVHFNADNLLYPNALQELANEIARPPRLIDSQGRVLDTNDIIIFPILMWNLIKFRNITWQQKGPPTFYTILTGIPPILQHIDCMQLVMKRSLWLAEGGWHDKRELSDGYLYEKFAAKYGYRTVGPVLGEHF